ARFAFDHIPHPPTAPLFPYTTLFRSRAAEEAAALVALVTVPMRVTGDAGWAACKTATFGGRVIAARSNLSDEELLALWKPLERRSEEHTSELQSRVDLVCRLLLEKKK